MGCDASRLNTYILTIINFKCASRLKMTIIDSFKYFLSKGSERTRNIKKNVIESVAIKGFSILIQLLLVPLTLDYLSPELYGIWLTLSSILLWLNFFDVGFTLGLKNKLAESIALGDYKRGKALVSTTYFVMIVIFVPLCLVLEFVLPYINWSSFLNVDQMYNEQLIEVMQDLIVCFSLQMIFNVISSILAAYQKVALSSVFPVVGNFLALIAIYLLTKFSQPSLLNLALAVSYLPVIVYFISSVIFFRGKLKSVSPSFREIDTSLIKEIFNLGVRFFIIQIQLIVLYQSTNILISNISSPLDVTSYNIAYKYISIALMLFNIVLSPLWPAYTDAYAKRDYIWMNNVYRRMIKLYNLLFIVIIIMVVFSPIAYHIWFGSKTTVPISMTVVVAVYFIVHSWDSLQVMLINGTGCVAMQTYMTLIGLFLHLPLSFLLGRYLGALGVVASMIIINIFYSIIFTIQIRKLLYGTASGIWLK